MTDSVIYLVLVVMPSTFKRGQPLFSITDVTLYCFYNQGIESIHPVVILDNNIIIYSFKTLSQFSNCFLICNGIQTNIVSSFCPRSGSTFNYRRRVSPVCLDSGSFQ